MPRLAVFSDVHGNVSALEAVRKAVKAAKPEATMIACVSVRVSIT